ncbi:MAG TPA: radical SAM protein, partial [Thermoplasmata archaeon]|nr:radical SAM protein [Thermoplasmata archaeon]
MTRPGSGAKRRAPEPGSPDRVLLVDPYLAREDPMERKFVEAYPSLGLLSLAGYLRARGADVEVVDLTFARDLRPLRSRLARFRPAIVGVHTKTLTKPRALAIASIARGSGAVTVAGGPDSASRTAAYLESGFDLVALGEGEATLEEIVARTRRGAPLEGTPGTAILRDRQVVRAPSRPFLRSLDELPMPAWDLLDLEGYLARWERRTGERRMAVLTSRGCPFDCSWCSKPTFGRTFRQRSADRVIEELRALKERYRVDYVRFCDDVFGIQRSWLEQLLGRLEEEALGLRFECLARVELLKPDLLDRMTRVGLARVYVGVESGSQKMLDLMNRGTRLAQIERTAESLRTHGVRQFWFLMLGYPGESLEDIEATLRLFRKFSPEEYSVSIAVPVPGTRFYEAVKDRLRSVRGRPAASGGRALLYEGAF